MKFKLILPAVAVMMLAQFAPQAAWSWGCHDRYGYIPPREARAIWRAEHMRYAPAPYGYAPCYYHRGFLSNFGRVVL
jgi:hypothetical protein